MPWDLAHKEFSLYLGEYQDLDSLMQGDQKKGENIHKRGGAYSIFLFRICPTFIGDI